MAWNSPRTWLAGEKYTAALTNQEIRDNFKAIGDAWTAYTPVWTGTTTNPVIGNGSLTGSWLSAGKLTIVKFQIVMGTTTTYGSGSWVIGLPAALTALNGFPFPFGIVQCFDASATLNHSRILQSSGSTTSLVAADSAGVRVTNLAPMTWANTDRYAGQVLYEAA